MKKLFIIAVTAVSMFSIRANQNQEGINTLLTELDSVSSLCSKYGIEWMNYSQSFMNAKFNQLKEDHQARAKLHHWFMGELKKEGLTEAVLRSKLQKVMQGHEQMMNQWEALANTYQEKARNLMLKKREAFEALTAKLNK